MSESNFSRRKFLANAAAISAVGVIGVNALSSCSGKKKSAVALNLPPLLEKAPVLKIKQPRLNLRISDTTSDFDATGKWLPRGHLASFQVETNLYELRNRPGISGAPIDIIVSDIDKFEYLKNDPYLIYYNANLEGIVIYERG